MDKSFGPHELDLAVANASASAPAVLAQRLKRSWSQSATVVSTPGEMEVVATQLFPAWLPGAVGIVTSAGAAMTGVRAVAFSHAADTAHYDPFLADLATPAFRPGAGPCLSHHPAGPLSPEDVVTHARRAT